MQMKSVPYTVAVVMFMPPVVTLICQRNRQESSSRKHVRITTMRKSARRENHDKTKDDII